MSDENEIEQALQGLRWSIPDELDRKALSDGLNAFDEVSTVAAPRTIRFRRRIWFKIIAAGATAAAAVLVFVAFAARASLTLADVQAAFEKQAWVHLKYDNGREEWLSLRDGRSAYKDEDGHVDFHDLDHGQRWITMPSGGRTAIFESKVWWGSKARTPWERVLGNYEGRLNGSERSDQVERHLDTVQGRRLVRFDIYYNDVQGNRLLIKQIWADPHTRLPVCVRERLQWGQKERQGREWITGEYQFPEAGPATIYDLGVARDCLVVKETDGAPDPRVQEMVAGAKQATEQFPSRFRALIWPGEGYGIAWVIYRDGKKVRESSYNIMSARDPNFLHAHLPMPASAEQVMAWTQTQVPVNIQMFDRDRDYWRYHKFFEKEPNTTVMVRRDLRGSSLDWPARDQWPYRNCSRLRPLDDPADLPPGCVALRFQRPDDVRTDFYVDPAHDYICVRTAEWRNMNGTLKRDSGIMLSGFVRLPSGQWLATERREIRYRGPERNEIRMGKLDRIDLKLLLENEFPPDTFNGKALLEGAKVKEY
jgi:hypothetical protein